MIIHIKEVKPLPNYILDVKFDDGHNVLYDVKEDIDSIPSYEDLVNIHGLFQQVRLDESRTCVVWNKDIDLPSDIIYEYGKEKEFESDTYNVAEDNNTEYKV